MGLPQGGRYELDYERAGNTVEMPCSRWVFSRLTRDDGLGAVVADRGAHRYTESFSYTDGYYDRGEREFRGFALLRITRADASEAHVRYLNRDHHTRGLEWQSQILGPASGDPLALWSQKTRRIQERIVAGSDVAFPAVIEETDRLYEPGADRYVESRKIFDYDEYGNLISLIDEGDTRISGDELYARIQYADLPGYFKQHPESIQVSDRAGTMLRHRGGEYGSRGELLKLQQFDNPSDSHTSELGWDPYGNLIELRDPRGSTRSWEYDAVVHRYVVRTTSRNTRIGGPQYESGGQWDYRWGTELERVDIAGERMSFSYDAFGRLIEARSPYDAGDMPAVRYSYSASSFPWYARTENKMTFDPSDTQTLETVLTIDGIGRCVQTAKQGEIWDACAARFVTERDAVIGLLRAGQSHAWHDKPLAVHGQRGGVSGKLNLAVQGDVVQTHQGAIFEHGPDQSVVERIVLHGQYLSRDKAQSKDRAGRNSRSCESLARVSSLLAPLRERIQTGNVVKGGVARQVNFRQ